PPRMRLSAILVNYHSLEPLLASLPALEAEMASLDHEIVLVDNSPGDGTETAVVHRHPRTRWLANDRNVGFARAVNRGIDSTSGDFILVLNPDCELCPGALGALLAHMDAHPQCALAGPRIEYPDGRLQYSARRYPSPATVLFNRYSLLSRLFPGNPWTREYIMSDWDHRGTRDVDWLSGACLLVRRAAVDRVGPLDPTYFMFNEDVDWAHRMNDAGWKVTYVPAARVVHRVGASRRRVSPRVVVERHRGMVHYYRKHHHPNPLLAAMVAALVMTRAGVMLIENELRPR
ncbi:MAG: glycosyltransferase family 2 protein, partial [Candidatus Eisenbacteria bacterium]